MEKAKISTKAMSVITFISVMVILLAASLAFGMTSSLGIASASNRGGIAFGADGEGNDGGEVADGENSASAQDEPTIVDPVYLALDRFSSVYDGLKREYRIAGFSVDWVKTLTTEQKENIAIVIPATWDDGKNGEAPVVEIGKNAFDMAWVGDGKGGTDYKGCTFSSLDMSAASNLKTIAHYAFQVCKGFSGSLTIPGSVTYMGTFAFYQCTGFDGTLKIPDNIDSLQNNTFQGCGFTGPLTIPNGVTYIGAAAFSQCSGFTGSLTIPSSVTFIGYSAFDSCSGFTGSLTIPSSVTTLQTNSFNKCTGLQTIFVNSDLSESDRMVIFDGVICPIVVAKENYNRFMVSVGFVNVIDKLAYEVQLKFDDNNSETNPDPTQNKLYNQKMGYEKNAATKVWAVNEDYTIDHIDKTGYTFGGWYFEPAFANKVDRNTLVLTETLYGKVSANRYTITFDANGGTGSTEGLKTAYGEVRRLPMNGFTKQNFYFNGWTFNGKTYANEASVKNLTTESETITLTANWSSKKPVSITIGWNGALVYDGNAKAIVIGGDDSTLTFVVEYSSNGVDWTAEAPITPGKYFYRVTRAEDITGDKLFAKYETNNEFEILNAKLTNITSDGFVGIYDGTDHCIRVTANAEQHGQVVSITYSLEEFGEYTAENPAIRNATIFGSDATVTVYFEISALFHITVREKAIILITPRGITIAADNKNMLVGGAELPLTGKIKSGELAANDSVIWALERETGNVEGKYKIGIGATVVADGNEGNNYFVTFENGWYVVDIMNNDVADAETPSNVGLIVGLCVGLPIGIGVILSLLWFGLKKKSSKKATPAKKN